jgi:hypothetical protein
MCTVLLPPGGYPIAVNKNINIKITEILNSRQAARVKSAKARAGGTVGVMYCRRASGRNVRGAPGYHGTIPRDVHVAGVGIQYKGYEFHGLYPHKILFM